MQTHRRPLRTSKLGTDKPLTNLNGVLYIQNFSVARSKAISISIDLWDLVVANQRKALFKKTG